MFNFTPIHNIPYYNKEVMERVRNIKREDMEKHPNPKFKIRIMDDIGSIKLLDMIARIQRSDLLDERLVMILPNPAANFYSSVAHMINQFGISCRNLHTFIMDEWADNDGNVAPLTYKSGFGYSFMKYFYSKIDPKLRMPESQVYFPTTENINDYSKMITDVGEGGADVCYSGPGWAGHIAFIDPNTPEMACETVEEFIEKDACIVTLDYLTIIQNSLHGVFGQSGDLASVPPRAATIGPADVKRARKRIESHGIVARGSASSWQRMVSRLILYGEVTPKVPASILQLWETDVYVSEAIARPIERMEKVGYI